MNAVHHGGRLNLRRLVVGELPHSMIAVKREGRAYRRALEAEVIKAKAEINVTDAHHIDTAAAATIQAGIARWLLRHRLDERVDSAKIVHKRDDMRVLQSVGMSTADILKCMETISKAKQIRDKAVAALNLDGPPLDPWVVLDALPAPSTNGATHTTSSEAFNDGKTDETT
jgi:hypothetical protein